MVKRSTTKYGWIPKNFTDRNNIQSVGISDTYDADKLTVNAADIKAYDSESGADVTDKFDIKVENGVIQQHLKLL